MSEINILLNDIKDASIKDVNIPRIPAFNFVKEPPVHQYIPPVTVNIGSPVVDLPGCVEFHKDERLKRENLPTDDEDGTVVLCDGQVPSYDPMDYEPEQLIIQQEVPPPAVEPPPEIDPPEVPPTGDLGKKEIECPAPNQPRVGDLTQNGKERVIGHEIQNGQCVVLYEDTTPVERFLPSTNQVSTTAAIAVIATASAAATPLLLRLIKPIIKKLTTTVQKKVGTHRELSRSEIMTNKYREKKGLPPLKVKKKKS